MSDILVEVAEAVPVEVNLPAKDNAIEMEVYYQDEVSLDTDLSLLYIKSGEKEIENYVETVSKPEIANYTNEYAKPIVTQIVNDTAEPLVEEYIEGTVKPSIDTYTNEKLDAYNANATSLTTAYATNAATLLAEYNANASEKQALVDAGAATATTQAGIATTKASEASNSATAAKNSQNAAATSASQSASSATASANSASASANSAALSKQYANDKINQTHITNCITEIPQDIKLELNNGTLTLKAGSRVYVPNGAGKFDVVTVASDKVVGQAGTVSGAFAFYRSDNGTCYSVVAHGLSSGTTAPSNPAITTTWYDTTNNVIKVYDGSKWVSGVAFPLCRFSNSNSLVTSIDQVFNGFGYIGSTVYALPGVKGLIPNGRNADGTLKNTEFTVDKVITATSTTPMDFYFAITPYSLTSGGGFMVSALGYTTSETPPSTNRWFKPSENMYYLKTNGVWGPDKQVHVGFGVNTANAITSFDPKLPFRAVDQNDFNRFDEEVTTLDAQNVKLTGNQMITGVKTAYGVNWGARCTSAVDTGTSLSAMEEKGLLIQDKNGQRIGTFFSGQLTDGRLRTYMCSSRRVNGTITYKTAEIVQAANGEGAFQINCNYATAPTPTSTDNSTKIATTAWVNTRVNPTGNNNSWKITYSNGFKIMGGYLAGANSGVYTVTFPTAFTNLPAILTGHLGTQGNGYVGTVASSKTGFTASVVSTTGRYTENSNGFTWVAYGF